MPLWAQAELKMAAIFSPMFVLLNRQTQSGTLQKEIERGSCSERGKETSGITATSTYPITPT